MKALSLTQPWATLIAIGAKRIETRSWSTNYRGPIAIHAAKGFPPGCRELCWTAPFHDAIEPTGLIDYGAYEDLDLDSVERFSLPLGAIVAIARLTAVERTEEISEIGRAVGGFLPHELDFGDYSPGRYGWVLAGVLALAEPVPCKGSLGLWTVPPKIEQQLANERDRQ